MCARWRGGRRGGLGGRRRRRESRRQEGGGRSREGAETERDPERYSRRRDPVEGEGAGRGGGGDGEGRERKGRGRSERAGTRGKRERAGAGQGSEFVRARVCVCARVCAGRAAGGGPALPSARPAPPARSPSPGPAAGGARRAGSMLSLLVWILTLSDTFSQGKAPRRAGQRGGAPRRAGAGAARGGARRDGPAGMSSPWLVSVAQVVSSAARETGELGAGGCRGERGPERSKSSAEPPAARPPSAFRAREPGRPGAGCEFRFGGGRCARKAGDPAPEGVAENLLPAAPPLVRRVRAEAPTPWGCPRRKGGVSRGPSADSEPLPAKARRGVEFRRQPPAGGTWRGAPAG